MSVENRGIFSHLFAGLPDDWSVVPLADAVDYQEGPGILAVDFHETGIPLLRLSSIAGAKTTFDGCDYLDPVKVEKKWSHFKLKVGDILLSTSGSLGRVSEVAKEQEGSLCYTGIIRFRPKIKDLKYSYIKYFLQSRLFEEQALASAAGSVLKHFGPSHLKQMSFPVPPNTQQEFIEKLIAPIDAKIQVNEKTNQTLEQMAQAIFKSWFVDFDPVRAKMEGRQPEGMNAETAALFPSEFEESELGLIPWGWHVNSLEMKFLPQKGKNITKKTITEGEVPVVAGGLSPAYYHNSHNVTAPVITISASGANAGFVNLYHQNIWASDCSYINRDIFENVYSAYLFLISRQDEISKMQQGAAQPHVYPKDLARLVLVDPPVEIWNQLERLITPFFEAMKGNIDQIHTLESIRNTLLPKLLSGELVTKPLESMDARN